MHYYTHNVGEFALETQGISLAHIGAYMRLVDRYVSTEKPIKTQWVSLAFSSDDVQIATEILEAFFEPADGVSAERSGWIHPRFAQEIATYQARAEINKANGKRGGRPKKTKETESVSSRFSAESEEEAKKSLTNNQEPRTKNQEPEIESASALSAQAPAPASTPARKRKPSSISSVEKPDEIDEQVWSDWLQIRKAKRLPLTQTAWSAMCVEAEKVGFTAEEAVKHAVERGWASFKAQWLLNEQEEQKRATASAEIKPLSERTMQDYESWLHPETWS